MNKNNRTIYTKIKDKLKDEHIFNKIITWKCGEENCGKEFIARIKSNSMKTTLNHIKENKNRPWYLHTKNEHGKEPEYPQNIKTISKMNETGIMRLDYRVQVEMAVNPKLILCTERPTYCVPKKIIQATKQIYQTE